MPHLLMIEDDIRLARMVGDYLRAAGLSVSHAEDGAAGLAALSAMTLDARIDLVLLDLMLPDADGLDVFRRMRRLPGAAGQVPVLMLTARGDPTDRVVGLELGAEDYVSKPFEPRELLARIRVVLRRGPPPARDAGPEHDAPPAAPPADVLHFGRLDIDRGALVARIDGEERALTSHQFALLAALAERAGRVLSREQLMEAVRGSADDFDPAFDRSIDVHIARIRAAIEDDPRHPRRVVTVRGVGYVFARQQDVDRSAD